MTSRPTFPLPLPLLGGCVCPRIDGRVVPGVVNSEVWTDERPRGAPHFHLYCIAESGAEESGPCKVGVATHISKRFSSLQCGNWRPLTVVWQIQVSTRAMALNVESHLLLSFRPSSYGNSGEMRLKSEWISATPMAALQVAVSYLNADEIVVKKAS